MGFICFVADQLSRLHMILKPFMLRRIKRDVENELSEKVWVGVGVRLCAFATVCLRFEGSYSQTSIEPVRILTVGLERAYNGGSCGEFHLNLKTIPRTDSI